MQYSVLLIIDEQENPLGLLRLDTAAGRFIILFQDEEKMGVIARYAADHILQPGQGMEAINMEISSIDETAREIGQGDPSLRDVTFLADSDSFATRMIASLRQRGP